MLTCIFSGPAGPLWRTTRRSSSTFAWFRGAAAPVVPVVALANALVVVVVAVVVVVVVVVMYLTISR